MVGSQLLIVAGAMVGAAGLILTQVMCTAMNRSLVSVLFGGALGGAAAVGGGGEEAGYTRITSCSPEECAMALETAERVVFVPGYGLAVANAQVRRPVGWWGLRCPVPCAPHLALAQALP